MHSNHTAHVPHDSVFIRNSLRSQIHLDFWLWIIQGQLFSDLVLVLLGHKGKHLQLDVLNNGDCLVCVGIQSISVTETTQRSQPIYSGIVLLANA